MIQGWRPYQSEAAPAFHCAVCARAIDAEKNENTRAKRFMGRVTKRDMAWPEDIALRVRTSSAGNLLRWRWFHPRETWPGLSLASPEQPEPGSGIRRRTRARRWHDPPGVD